MPRFKQTAASGTTGCEWCEWWCSCTTCRLYVSLAHARAPLQAP